MPKAARTISSLFEIPNRFVRSVQLERDFQDPAALDDYIVTPAMAEAFTRLREALLPDSGRRAWRITGDYGVGKSSFALVVAHLLARNSGAGLNRIASDLGWDMTGMHVPALWPVLLTGSRSSMVAALARAIGVAVEARAPARGRVPRAHVALLEQAAAIATANDALALETLLTDFRALAAESGAGVLLVVDELGKFLEYAAQADGVEDVFILQRLAEMASRSGKRPFLVLGLLHQGFHAYADRLPMAARNEWEKVAGRFEEIVFNQPLAHMAALVAGALRLDPARLPARVRDVSSEIAAATAQTGWLGGGAVGAAALDVARLYPIHPTVLPVLVRFFARFGQHERSLFGFLLSNEPFGLQSFATRSAAPETWYRLDDLYDYVRACFGHRLAGASYRSHWLRIVSTIDAIIDASDFELRLLKAVAVLNLIDADDLIPTERALAACFSPDRNSGVSDALRELAARGLLFHRGAAGGFRLWPTASVNLEEALQEARRALGPVRSVSAGLIPHLSPEPVMARRHYLEHGTLRYFEVRYCEASELANCAAKPSDADGVLLVILADDEESRTLAIDAAQRPTLASREDIVLSFPAPVAGLAGELLDLRLWNWVAQNVAELAEDTYAMSEVSRQETLARRALLGRLSALNGMWQGGFAGECVWKGQPLDGKLRELGISGLLSHICAQLYPAAPRIANELLNRSTLSSAAVAARMRLIERIFDMSELADLGLPESKAPPEKSIYLSVLKAGRLHVETDTGYAVTFPDEEDPLRLRPALDAILGSIAAAGGDRVAVLSLLGHLRAPPYGVRDGVSPLLLAIVLRTHAHELAVYEHGTFLHRFGPSDFQRIIKGPQYFEIQHCQVSGVRLEVFDALIRNFAEDRHDRKIDLLDVVKPLCLFAAQLPDFTKKANGLSPIARAVREALLASREPLRLLFDDLPRACELEAFSPDDDQGDAAEARLFVERLQDAIDELRHAYDALLTRIQSRTSQALGQPVFDRVAVASRASRVSLVARDPRLRTFALRLRDPALSEKAWAEALGSYIVAKPPAKWLAADEARFEEEAGTLAEHFCKTEAAAFQHPDMPPQVAAVRLNLTRGDGEDLVRVLENPADDDLAKDVDAVAGRLPRDATLRLRLLTELLWRELKAAPATHERADHGDAPRGKSSK
jgi:hypothetical protein